ncbi:MAG: ABC transporter permease subunit [Clostridia bacterium]|nr:ABC transporter permease subunit [Clostridia bacterium]
MKNNKNKKILIILVSIVVLIALWGVVALLVGSNFLLPTPWSVAGEFIALLGEGEFYFAIFSTTLRALIGFGISFVLAMIFAIVAYLKPTFYTAFAPFMTVIRATPTMSLLLLAFAWFSEESRPIFIGFLVSFPLLYEGIHNALAGVDIKLVEMAKVYDVAPKTMIKKLYLPLSRNGVLSSVKSGIALNLKVVISAEVMVNTLKSMGWYMNVAQLDLATARLFAWTLSAILLSFLFEGLVELLRYLTRPKKRKCVIPCE